jgi:DNA adenine methylase
MSSEPDMERKDKDAVFFIDSPYTAGGKRAGSRLYTHFEVDHEKTFLAL